LRDESMLCGAHLDKIIALKGFFVYSVIRRGKIDLLCGRIS